MATGLEHQRSLSKSIYITVKRGLCVASICTGLPENFVSWSAPHSLMLTPTQELVEGILQCQAITSVHSKHSIGFEGDCGRDPDTTGFDISRSSTHLLGFLPLPGVSGLAVICSPTLLACLGRQQYQKVALCHSTEFTSPLQMALTQVSARILCLQFAAEKSPEIISVSRCLCPCEAYICSVRRQVCPGLCSIVMCDGCRPNTNS